MTNPHLAHLIPPDPLTDLGMTPATAEDWELYVEALDAVATAFPVLAPEIEPRSTFGRERARLAREAGNIRANNVPGPLGNEGDPALDVRQIPVEAPPVPVEESLGMADRQLGNQPPQP